MRKVIVSALLAVLSGCAGMGVEGRVGLYREDTRKQESQAFDKSIPCIMWNDCTATTPK